MAHARVMLNWLKTSWHAKGNGVRIKNTSEQAPLKTNQGRDIYCEQTRLDIVNDNNVLDSVNCGFAPNNMARWVNF